MKKGINGFAAAFMIIGCCLSPVIAQQPQKAPPKHSTLSDESGGILYGDYGAFSVEAGQGWVLDEQAGEAQGVTAVFYRKGASWTNGVAVMYITVEPQDKRSLPTIIKQDIVKQQRMFPSAQPKPQPSLWTGDHTSATVYAFQPNKPGKSAWERVAYISTHKSIVMLILTARTQAAYQKAKPAFDTLVQSFLWMDRK